MGPPPRSAQGRLDQLFQTQTARRICRLRRAAAGSVPSLVVRFARVIG
jgi:hypothetical protein